MDPIAVYAAVVATGALFLEVRRWFENGPRIRLHVAHDMRFINDGALGEDVFLMLTVTNTGTQATTLTHLLLEDYGSVLSKLRGKPNWNAIVPYPNQDMSMPNLPSKLEPGDQWQGMVSMRPETEIPKRREGGQLHIGIQCSHRSKPYYCTVKPALVKNS